jgi:hypothetical protein
MQTTFAVHNMLTDAAKARRAVKFFLRPLSLFQSRSNGIPVDDGRYNLVGYRLDNEERQPAQVRIDGWLAPFWRAMEETGWRVANKYKLVNGEVVWSLVPMEQTKNPGIPTREDLLSYVEKIRPMAGVRAQRALEIAISGKIQRLPLTENGHDCWQVLGSRGDIYEVSIKGRYCSCPDAENGAPRWMDGPLCKHRLAVMYITRWEEETGKQLRERKTVHAVKERGADSNGVPEEYVTIAPPSSSAQGWRWVHVRGNGRLAMQSNQEFPTHDEALRVAQTIAQCKAVPFYLNGH